MIDTVSFHFRHGFEDFTQKARALDDLAIFLHGLAADFDLAVGVVFALSMCTDESLTGSDRLCLSTTLPRNRPLMRAVNRNCGQR